MPAALTTDARGGIYAQQQVDLALEWSAAAPGISIGRDHPVSEPGASRLSWTGRAPCDGSEKAAANARGFRPRR